MKRFQTTKTYFVLCMIVGVMLFMLDHFWENYLHDKRSLDSPLKKYSLTFHSAHHPPPLSLPYRVHFENKTKRATEPVGNRNSQRRPRKIPTNDDEPSNTDVTDDTLIVTDLTWSLTDRETKEEELQGFGRNNSLPRFGSYIKEILEKNVSARTLESGVKDIGEPVAERNDSHSLTTEIFPLWTTSNPHDKTFTRRLYVYSAIIALHSAPPGGTDIHLVTFQDGRQLLPLTCCLKLQDGQLFIGEKAVVDFSPTKLSSNNFARDLRNVGVVYRCRFPFNALQLHAARVTLSSTSCPADVSQYLRVYEPEVKPGGLAICAKIAYGLRLDPYKLVEWFEMQRLLGVDKIQLFDLNNTKILYRVFQHYQDMGLLDLLPYKLPGRPWGRFVLQGSKDWTRFGDDKEVPVWDCRLRLAGYDYVMTLDLDEVILPRHFTQLKPFLQREFSHRDKVAGLMFKVQFFLSHWGPVDPAAPLLFMRYLNSTAPRWEVHKHVYRPCKTHQALTHEIYPYQGYRGFVVAATEATVFHYRACKQNWLFSCEGPRVTDRSMLRFTHPLLLNVASVRQNLGI